MNKIKLLLTLCLCLLGMQQIDAQPRLRQSFDAGWLFSLSDDSLYAAAKYDDNAWRQLNVPHDWAIEGDFSPSNPSGASGGALPGGIGWYRKHFQIGEVPAERRYILSFDGVYMNSTVYINGYKVGYRPYGYSSFEYDITPYLLAQQDNVVAVKVDNSDQPNSRWYSGCGIYRHVWLTETPAWHVANWGVHVETTGKGEITVSVNMEGKQDEPNSKIRFRHTILDSQGHAVAQSNGSSLIQRLRVKNPMLWSPETPYVYNVRTEVLVAGEKHDEVNTPTGFRTFRFDAETGFWLNGKNMKINGVCQHHDMGSLGAALNESALHRQLLKLKQMGTNAIRCSHNPPSPELLNMCDTMGFIVMDESFDMWRRKKTQNDYARFFDEWHERDLADLVLRDRNHPSVLMWSIGNEVLEQWDADGQNEDLTAEQANLLLNAGHNSSAALLNNDLSANSLLTIHLASIIRKLDDTRPITAGCNEPDPTNHLFRSGAIDVIGFNYHHEWVKDVPKNFPNKAFMFSESVSALQTRGFYRMPSDSIYIMPERWDRMYTDPSFMCSAYDNSHAPWSSTHEETWDVVKHTPYCAGQFIWTGWDYLGEPTPYAYPARSSYFGIIDLAGFPKDAYYLYQSEWTTQPTLHLFPHWNWIPGQEVDMWCYFNQGDEVELFVNGKSQGVKHKEEHCYHAQWRVTYEPGEVCVIERKEGEEVARKAIQTAGVPHHIRLCVDYQGVEAKEKYGNPDFSPALTFVNVEVLDREGRLCPWAEEQVFFTSSGDVEIVGVDNGSPFSLERFKDDKRRTFFGKAVVVLKGHGEISASSYNMPTAKLAF